MTSTPTHRPRAWRPAFAAVIPFELTESARQATKQGFKPSVLAWTGIER